MKTPSFKHLLAGVGPDVVRRSPGQSTGDGHTQPCAASGSPIERLESRVLFAGTASVSGNVLSVTGTADPDNITIYRQDATPNDVIWVDFAEDGVAPYAFFDNTFATISILAGGGADVVLVGNSIAGYHGGNLPVNRPVSAYGQDGDDQIEGTDGNDTMVGGNGYDTLSGFDGADLMYGGLSSGSGTDSAGDDYLEGGEGNDSMYGEGGADTLLPSNGNDYINGGDGNDTIRADDDPAETDTLDGGAGTDCGWWDGGTDVVSNMEGKF